MTELKLTYSIADQNFLRTKSLGILNVSLHLLGTIDKHRFFKKLDVLSNSTLSNRLKEVSPSNTIHIKDIAIRGTFWRIIWDQYLIYNVAQRLGNTWLFLPKGFASFIRRCPVRLSLLSHDALIDYYDDNYPTAFSKLESMYFKQCMKANFRYADLLFCSSQFTSSEMERLAKKWNCPKPNMVTLGLGVEQKEITYERERNSFVVLVSRFPHKRTDLAVKYMDRWQLETHNTDIVHWVGRFPKEITIPSYSNWHFYDRIEEVAYRKLMSMAKVLIYFTEYEGYGLPPIESVMAGVCPVYSDIPATREAMIGLGCAFQNNSYDSFGYAMRCAKQTTLSTIEEWASKLSQKHSWAVVAQRMVNALCVHEQAKCK